MATAGVGWRRLKPPSPFFLLLWALLFSGKMAGGEVAVPSFLYFFIFFSSLFGFFFKCSSSPLPPDLCGSFLQSEKADEVVPLRGARLLALDEDLWTERKEGWRQLAEIKQKDSRGACVKQGKRREM